MMTELDPFLRQTLECSVLPYIIFKYENNKMIPLLASDGFYRVFHEEKKPFVDFKRMSYERIHEDDVTSFLQAIEDFANTKNKLDVTFRLYEAYDEQYHSIKALGKHFNIGEENLLIIWYHDLSDKSRPLINVNEESYESTINIISNYYEDELTGLPRMSNFFRIVENLLQENPDKKYMLLAFDFTGMKAFNVKYGFEKGNELLIQFANLLKKHFKKDVLSHFGEDHFYVCTECRDVKIELEHLFEETSKINNGQSLPVRVGIYDGKIEFVSRACDKARFAADIDRNSLVSCYRYYEDKFLDNINKKDYIVKSLDVALENHWIIPYYQPIMRAINNKISDEEALARWIDPSKGIIKPNDFISVLEDAKLIYKLDLAILDQVLKDFVIKKELGIALNPVSVNISRYDFESCDIVGEIINRVKESQISPSLITIELTESIVQLEKNFLTDQIARLHEAGFKVWMDDFGSGFSSLNNLQNFDFDAIKIDMAFLSTFSTNDKTPSIIKETLKIAEHLGIETVCEGVSSEEEREFLLKNGCTKLQGYLFNYPNPLETILTRPTLLRENPAEQQYYETLSTTSLENLSANGDLNTIAELAFISPMVGIVEYDQDGVISVLRATEKFTEICLENKFVTRQERHFTILQKKAETFFDDFFSKCVKSGNWESEKLTFDDTVTTYMIRNIAVNPVTNTKGFLVILSIHKKEVATRKFDFSDNDIKNLMQPDQFPLPFIAVSLNKEADGETSMKYVYANEAYSDFVSIPLDSLKNVPLKVLLGDTYDSWLELAMHVKHTKKMVDGERFGSLSRSWFYYKITPTNFEDVYIIIFTKLDKESGIKSNSVIQNNVYDDVYRISKIFKLNENHNSKVKHALFELRKIVNCDELAIVELKDKKIVNTFEACRDNIKPIFDEMPLLNEKNREVLYGRYINSGRNMVVDDISTIKGRNEKLFKHLKDGGIKRFIIIPIIYKKKLLGLFLAGNYDLSLKEYTLEMMNELTDVISIDIYNNNLLKTNEAPKTQNKKINPVAKFFKYFKESFFLGEKNTTELQFITKENMKLAIPTSIMFISFETLFIPLFIAFCLVSKRSDPTLYYTTTKWIVGHVIAFLVLMIANVGLLIFAAMYMKGKLDGTAKLTRRAQVIIDLYIILCNIFGILISAADFQVGGQIIVFVMMTMYSLSLYRVYPIKAILLDIFSFAMLYVCVYLIKMVDTPVQMAFDAPTTTNIIGLAILQGVLAFALYRSRLKMVTATIIDKLSKTKSRFVLEEDFKFLKNKPIVVMMLDVDNFKPLNDLYGHANGDKIITQIGKSLIESFGADSVYRYGGDEFLIIKKYSITQFEEDMKQLDLSVESNTASSQVRITFSAGYKVTIVSSYDMLERAITEADLLLYEAKKHGKNQILKDKTQVA